MDNIQVSDAGLLAMRHVIEKTAQNIGQMESKLHDERQVLQEKVEAYTEKRVDFFKQALVSRGLTWCTYCSKIVPEADVGFLFVEGKSTYSHGYGNAFYGIRSFATLHQACSACREKAMNRHGWKDEYDSQLKDQPCYYAFRAEKREDGFYACRFGEWVRLNDEQCKFGELPKDLVEKHAEEYSLPAKITFDYDGRGFCLSDRKLVIHEQTTIAEAV